MGFQLPGVLLAMCPSLQQFRLVLASSCIPSTQAQAEVAVPRK